MNRLKQSMRLNSVLRQVFDQIPQLRARLDRMLTAILATTLLSVSLVWPSPGVARGGDLYYPSLELRANEARALVDAVRHFDCGSRQLVPCSTSFTVQILRHSDDTEIIFLPDEGNVAILATVDAKGGVVVSKHGSPAIAVAPIVVPGILASELAAAWSAEEGRVPSSTLASLSTVRLSILAGGAIVTFIPNALRTNLTCLTGNCDDRSSYEVRLSGGTVTIAPKPSL